MACRSVFTGAVGLSCPATPRWFAIRVRSNFEKPAAAVLGERGYENLLPLYRRRRRSCGRTVDVELPLFAGYVFGRFNFHDRLPVLQIPGFVSVVGFGSKPVPVEEAEIAAIRSMMASGIPAEPWPFLHEGDRILIERGPLAGVEGILTSAKGAWRLVASVTLLQRSVAVEIDRDWVRALPKPNCRPAAKPRLPGAL